MLFDYTAPVLFYFLIDACIANRQLFHGDSISVIIQVPSVQIRINFIRTGVIGETLNLCYRY